MTGDISYGKRQNQCSWDEYRRKGHHDLECCGYAARARITALEADIGKSLKALFHQ